MSSSKNNHFFIYEKKNPYAKGAFNTWLIAWLKLKFAPKFPLQLLPLDWVHFVYSFIFNFLFEPWYFASSEWQHNYAGEDSKNYGYSLYFGSSDFENLVLIPKRQHRMTRIYLSQM